MSDEPGTPHAHPEADRPTTTAAETPTAAVAIPEPAGAQRASFLAPTSAPRSTLNLVYALLTLAAIGAIVALVILLTRPGDPPQPAWSTFQPTQPGLAGAQEIADYVGTRYLFADGTPIVRIAAAPLTLAGNDVQTIVVRAQDTLGREQDYLLPAEGNYAYTLCGDGESCSITAGTPSRKRMQTLQYGALELALYSFRYLGAQSVVTFLPPAPGTTPQFALVFQRSDLGPLVDAPVATTVPDGPLTPDGMQPVQGERIDQIAKPRTFRYDYTQLSSGAPALVLSDPDLQQLQPLFGSATGG